MTPNEAIKPRNEAKVRKILYPKKLKSSQRAKFAVNDTVRVSRKSHVFTKSYRETFSHEIFEISKVRKTSPITYTLKDWQGENILGSFYEAELLKVDKRNNVYPIDRVIKRRNSSNGVELYVSWKGYGPSANSWIKESELYPIRNAPQV